MEPETKSNPRLRLIAATLLALLIIAGVSYAAYSVYTFSGVTGEVDLVTVYSHGQTSSQAINLTIRVTSPFPDAAPTEMRVAGERVRAFETVVSSHSPTNYVLEAIFYGNNTLTQLVSEHINRSIAVDIFFPSRSISTTLPVGSELINGSALPKIRFSMNALYLQRVSLAGFNSTTVSFYLNISGVYALTAIEVLGAHLTDSSITVAAIPKAFNISSDIKLVTLRNESAYWNTLLSNLLAKPGRKVELSLYENGSVVNTTLTVYSTIIVVASSVPYSAP